MPYANVTIKRDDAGLIDGAARGIVDGGIMQSTINNAELISLHYQTKNPLTPEFLTPTVDVDAGFLIEYNEESNSWNVQFNLRGDGYPSTEAFLEDSSGQRILIGTAKETGTPLTRLPGKADTPLFSGTIDVKLDDNFNFIEAKIEKGKKAKPIKIEPAVKP